MRHTVSVDASGPFIKLRTQARLEDGPLSQVHPDRQPASAHGENVYHVRKTPVNAFLLRYGLRAYTPVLEAGSGLVLAALADQVPLPCAFMSEDGRHIEVVVPPCEHYRELMGKVQGYAVKKGVYKVGVSRILDLKNIQAASRSPFPPVAMSEEVEKVNSEPVEGFDGTLESLKSVPLDVLHVVSADVQTFRSRKASSGSLSQKMADLGITCLYDLLMWVPRRYIDKTRPSGIDGLVEGETAVVVGTVAEVSAIPSGRGGVAFRIKTEDDRHVKVSFFNQSWLSQRFKPGSNVLVTGKVRMWRGRPQVAGESIEHSDEAASLPVVPVYRQSPSKGLTTNLIMSACREALSRLDRLEPPSCMPEAEGMSYLEAVSSLHFPESAARQREAVNLLALHEMVAMQVLLLHAKAQDGSRSGVESKVSSRRLQARAVRSLPFELTGSQREALDAINSHLACDRPSSLLLSADVGAGKTVVALMAALRSVEAGHQVAVLAPTDVLARQIYTAFARTCRQLGEDHQEKVVPVLLSGSMKVKERKAVLAAAADGSADIVVGTHSLMSGGAVFRDLGLVVVDEQQKFGVRQRDALLSARTDGKVPDMLTMTATPIPRSTAQVFYGDVDMLELKDKPPGRLPIITRWVECDPVGLTAQVAHPVWQDVKNEAARGNQTFVVTPLLTESEKVDAASVERTYKNLSSLALAGLRVGYVHGKMKQEEQSRQMGRFRDKELDVLVASTVVEVGVDVPDATRVVILSADRLGAASLHQVRGRVGRSSKQSACYLVSEGRTASSRERMKSLVESNDGFEIARRDLEVRGEGLVLGDQQSGRNELRFASVVHHADKIQEAKEQAARILGSPEAEEAVRQCRKMLGAEE